MISEEEDVSHFFNVQMIDNQSSTFFWCTESPKTLVIFVHGFTGDAIKTWDEFPRYVNGAPKLLTSDVIFYNYSSTKFDVTQLASNFEEFLLELLQDPSKHYLKGYSKILQRLRGNIDYEKVVIVAHSLGAIIARTALLMQPTNLPVWDEKVELVFFAPAHMGARDSLFDFKLLVERLLGVFGLVLNRSLSRISSLEDLRVNSATLTSLREKTYPLQMNDHPTHTIAKLVVIAGRESVVNNNQFCGDPKPIRYEGETHTSVCKPRQNFQRPWQDFLNCL